MRGQSMSLSLPSLNFIPKWSSLTNRQRWIIGGTVAVIFVFALIIASRFSSSPQWRPVVNSEHVTTMISDPSDPQHILLGIADGKVYSVQTDKATVQLYTPNLPQGIKLNTLLAFSDKSIVAGTNIGLYISQSGNKWQSLGKGLPANDSIIVLMNASNDEKTIMAGTSHSGLYLSNDKGATWNKTGNGLPPDSSVTTLASNPDHTIWFVALGSANLFTSQDMGQNWQVVNTGLPSESTVLSIAVDPQNIYMGTDRGLYLSSDSGQSWSKSTNKIGQTRVTSLSTNPKRTFLLATTDAGIFTTNDEGKTWESLTNEGLPQTNSANIALVVPSDKSGEVYYIASDRAYIFNQATNNGLSILLRILIFALLIGILYFVWQKQQKKVTEIIATSQQISKSQQAKNGTNNVSAQNRQTSSRSSRATTIRGGPPLCP
jgi:photosystem II stability/assembly factor-like uncharacterized protein